MYVQFNATDREKLNDSLRILNKDVIDIKAYQNALDSALSVLINSRPEEGKSLEWAAEMIPAYREIGRTLIKYMAHVRRAELVLSQFLEIEKEFANTLGEYDGENVMEKMRAILRDLEHMQLSGYEGERLTSKVMSALKDAEDVYRVMHQYDIKDEGDLEAALKERKELREQADLFERGI